MSSDVDLETGVHLPNGTSVYVISSNKRFRSEYKIFDENGELTRELEGASPHMMTRQSQIGRIIWDACPVKNRKKEFSELKEALAEFQDYIESESEELAQQEQIEKEEQYQRDIDNAMGIYEGLDSPVLYLASCIDWITAGERANILISFFTLCSQVVLKHPISLVGVGEGSSGKNHVCESALSLIPEQYVVMEKKPTLASMFRRSEEDPKYYDGKIVVYGDMGGDSDQEDVEETKNILKELQTDGKVNRPVTVKTADGFEVVDLCLLGNPCLVYQTVPNYHFDDQELSRSMLTTPRTDNKREYNLMMHYLELVNGKTYNQHTKIRTRLQEMIPLIVEGLRRRFKNIHIINPYMETIEEFVGKENPHYKRDLPKFNSVLKVITAFNGCNRETHTVNGVRVMFTNKEDVALFLTLFEDYREAISHNLTKKAFEILNDLKANLGGWCYDSEEDKAVFDASITTATYMKVGNVKNLSLRSVQRYFSELREHGYLSVVGKQGNSSLYSLAKKSIDSIVKLENLSEHSKRILSSEYSTEILDLVLQDFSNDQVCIFEQHTSISIPPWMVK
ncbi:MAG: hypothetical protein IJP99_10660 [Methanobrevibacter sp.]|nr:hypothetical protein [Methanobrevibacter sp.]MBR0059779.1 hypothetical protein [Methanobrevibacter sp.]